MAEGESIENGSSSRAKAQREGGSPPTFQLTRRQSAKERVDGILETARGRAESLSASRPGQPLLGGAVPSSVHSDDGLFMRAPEPAQPPNYKTLTQTTARPEEMGAPENGQTAGADGDSGPRRADAKDGWLREKLKRFRSIELENKGSVARDHLALERTFLAWLRTSLAFASIGVGVTQLFRLNTTLSDPSQYGTLRSLGKPLGTTFLVISIVMLLLGYRRYVECQHYVIRGKFPASRGTVIFVSLVAFAVMAVSLVVIVSVQTS